MTALPKPERPSEETPRPEPARVQVMPAVDISAARRSVEAGMGATRDLNEAVHKVLIVGLTVSAGLMVLGLVLALATGTSLPTDVLRPGEAVASFLRLQPAGFFSLGLIALILTPLMRVVGSVGVFIWERDRRYTVLTLVVMVVMLIGLYIGQG